MFDEIIDFLVNNWYLVAVVIVFIFNFIICLLTAGKLNIQALVAYLQELPFLIKEAESSGLDGKEKFTLVFSRSIVYIAKLLGSTEKKVCSKYANFISDAIENILSTPEKKKGE